jgi:hypothetical protein
MIIIRNRENENEIMVSKQGKQRTWFLTFRIAHYCQVSVSATAMIPD